MQNGVYSTPSAIRTKRMGAPSGALFARKNSPFTKPETAHIGGTADDILPHSMCGDFRTFPDLTEKYRHIKCIIRQKFTVPMWRQNVEGDGRGIIRFVRSDTKTRRRT